MNSKQNIENAIKMAKEQMINDLTKKIRLLLEKVENINNMSECSRKRLIKYFMEIHNLEFEIENLQKMNIKNILEIIEAVQRKENRAFNEILKRRNNNFANSLIKNINIYK